MVKIRHMANTFRKVYKKTGNSGSASDYQLVGNIGVNGIELDIMKGATVDSEGEIGLVPKPPILEDDTEEADGWNTKFLASTGEWVKPTPFDGIWNDLYVYSANVLTDPNISGDFSRRIISQGVASNNNSFYITFSAYGTDDWVQLLQFQFYSDAADGGSMGLNVRTRIWGRWSKWHTLI